MAKKKFKIAVIYNESAPELYHYKSEIQTDNLSFTPYFEVDRFTPMDEYELLAQRLQKVGFKSFTYNVKDDVVKLIDLLEEEKPDAVFNFIELIKDNPRLEMSVAGIFELLKIPYTGAPPLALANAQNKALTKRILHINGILTSRFMVIKYGEKEFYHLLDYPIIVKPAYEDASVGIDNNAIVFDDIQLKNRINFVFDHFKQAALIEEYIEGRELNVAVFGDENPIALPISEIDFSEMPDHLHNIVSYQAKWDPLHESYHKTIPICPAPLSKKIEKKIKEIAIKSFKVMGVRDYSRVDIRLSKSDVPYVLEVNPNPDLTEGAGFMRSAEAGGYAYNSMLKEIVLLALKRGEKLKVKGK